ncbi:MAG TPA: hypothetical protein VNW28_10030 [Chthoniobacterales bacterium]|nr:hypothetical protein [Chthoniobacterales bacterium]
MANPTGKAFSRRAPDIITEELVAVFASKASFEFKPLFDVVFANLRARNAASGGEEMLRLRSYEKLQSLVDRGAVKKTIAGTVKKYKGVSAPLTVLNTELQQTRLAWSQRAVGSAAAA